MTATNESQHRSIQEIDGFSRISEATALLSTSLSDLDATIARNDTTESYIKAAAKEFSIITPKAMLATLTLLLEMSFYTVDIMVVGRLGGKELGAISLAVTLQVVLGMAITFGLVSAMETFCSNAFTASSDKTLVGFHFQRGIIAVCTHSVILAPIFWNMEQILLFLRQDPDIAYLSGLYLRIQILNTLPFGLFETTKRYLQAQGIMEAGTIITAIVAPVHWISCYMLVHSSRFGIGYVGAPIINLVSNSLLLIGIVIYTRNSRAAATWGGWNPRAFRNMWAFYRVALPSIVTICADWFSLELLTIGASYFGADQLAGNSIVINNTIIIYHFSNGIGYSVSSRIGNLIGGAKPRQARIAAYISLLVAGFSVTLGCIILTLFGKWWMSMYTGDLNVIREALKLHPVACIMVLGDGINSVLAAILRGLGRQQTSANIFLWGFYAFALPIAVYLGYLRHMETVGLWWGTCTGVFVIAAVQIIYICINVSWRNEVHLCVLRLRDNSSDNIRE